MKKQSGFTLVELIVAMGVTAVVLTAAVLSFRDSTKANSTITQKSDMSDNIRSGLNLIVQDLIQTGTGIPTGGISIPNTVNASGCNVGKPVNRPPASLSLTFQGPNSANAGCNVILPAIEPGPDLGPTITSPDGTKGPASDVITILYVDNTLSLDAKPINGPACPKGVIDPKGAFITFDSGATCGVTIGAAGIPVNVGDLIMIYNANGNCLQTVSSVSGQTLNFAAGDAFNLNGRTATETAGTILQLQNLSGGVPNGTFPSTSATRIWMVTYYLAVPVGDTTHPQLMRELNFNAPQAVAEVLENLQFAYNLADGTSPAPSNQNTVPAGDNESEIRSVNVYIGARSTSTTAGSGQFARTNLATQVALRSMAYFNTYK
jgi:prepilin-type N-terminal cleavage/methylation domain-containing protein